VAGDGTCFYAAFAQGLLRGALRSRKQTHQAATIVRLKVGNALCGSDGHLKDRDLEPQRWDLGVSETQYCRGLLERHTAHPTLADDIIITAAGKLYNVNIAIFRAEKEAIYLNYKAVRGSRLCVYLWRTQRDDPMGASDHYDALLLRTYDPAVTPLLQGRLRATLAGRRTSRGRVVSSLTSSTKRRRVDEREAPKRRVQAETGSHYQVLLSKLCALHVEAEGRGWQDDTRVVIEGSAYEHLRARSRQIKRSR
jgi:hypothetical protein